MTDWDKARGTSFCIRPHLAAQNPFWKLRPGEGQNPKKISEGQTLADSPHLHLCTCFSGQENM